MRLRKRPVEISDEQPISNTTQGTKLRGKRSKVADSLNRDEFAGHLNLENLSEGHDLGNLVGKQQISIPIEGEGVEIMESISDVHLITPHVERYPSIESHQSVIQSDEKQGNGPYTPLLITPNLNRYKKSTNDSLLQDKVDSLLSDLKREANFSPIPSPYVEPSSNLTTPIDDDVENPASSTFNRNMTSPSIRRPICSNSELPTPWSPLFDTPAKSLSREEMNHESSSSSNFLQPLKSAENSNSGNLPMAACPYETNQREMNLSEPLGFKTAKGKTVQISELLLQKAKKKFQEDGANSNSTDVVSLNDESTKKHASIQSPALNHEDSKNPSPDISATFTGFKNARGKSINIDESKLSWAKTFLEEAHPVKQEPTIQTQSQAPLISPLKNQDMLANDPKSNDTIGNLPIINLAAGFHSAKGKAIAVDQSKMKWAENFFKESPSKGDYNDPFLNLTSHSCQEIEGTADDTLRKNLFVKYQDNQHDMNAQLPQDEKNRSPSSHSTSSVRHKFQPSKCEKNLNEHFKVDSPNIPKISPKPAVSHISTNIRNKSVSRATFKSPSRMKSPTQSVPLASNAQQNLKKYSCDKVKSSQKILATRTRKPYQLRYLAPHLPTGNLFWAPFTNDRCQESWRSLSADTVLQYKFDGWNSDHARNELVELGCMSYHVTEEWCKNHYRWIVWKLASYERLFENAFVEKILTRETVIKQLMYRYECEYHRAQRSSLKKIAERDDLSSRHMVLCIASIKRSSNSSEEGNKVDLELTDGWYSLWASVDGPLSRAIQSGRIFIGQKISIVGASLLGETEPLPILEAGTRIYLKLSANSTKPAHWYKKLGYQRSSIFLRSVSSIHIDGGLVPGIQAIIVRRYPLRFLETDNKGSRVIAADDFPTGDENQDEFNGQATCKIDSLFEFQRKWIPFLRLKLKVSLHGNQERFDTFFLTMWRPDEDVLADLHEGHRIEIRCVIPSARLSKNGQSLHLSSSSSTRYKILGKEKEKHLEYVANNTLGLRRFDGVTIGTEISDVDLALCILKIEPILDDPSQALLCFGCTPGDQLVFLQLYSAKIRRSLLAQALTMPMACFFRNLTLRGKDPRFDLISFSSNDYTEFEQPSSKHMPNFVQGPLLELTSCKDKLIRFSSMIETIMAGNTSSQWVQAPITQIHVPTPHIRKTDSSTQPISIGKVLPSYQSTPLKILQSTTPSLTLLESHFQFLDNGISIQFSENPLEKESPEIYAQALIKTLQSS